MNYLQIIPSAFADQPAAQGNPGIMGNPIFLFVGLFAIMYFVIIRPQRKQTQNHQTFLSTIQKGDEVITQSGLLGKVTGLTEKVVTLEIAPNVKVKVLKSTVLQKVDQALAAVSNS